jgi:hypothetical protein
MKDDWFKYAIIVAAILIVLTVWKRKAIMAIASGVIKTKPEDVARDDGVPVEIESLARAMESEESGNAARTAVGWAIKNKAKKSNKTITRLVTASKNKEIDGFYGQQDKGPKYCSTYKSPSGSTLQLAQAVYSGSVPDPTRGATQWDAPRAQDALHAKNPTKWKSSEDIKAKREGEGKRMVIIDGVPNTRFWA